MKARNRIIAVVMAVLMLTVPSVQYRASSQVAATATTIWTILKGLGGSGAIGEKIMGLLGDADGLRQDAEILAEIATIIAALDNQHAALDSFSQKYSGYIEKGREAYSLAQNVIYVNQIWNSLEGFGNNIKSYYQYAQDIPEMDFYQVTQCVAQGERIILSLTNEAGSVIQIIKGQMGSADAVSTTGILRDYYLRCESLKNQWNRMVEKKTPTIYHQTDREAAEAMADAFSVGGILDPMNDASYSFTPDITSPLDISSEDIHRSGSKTVAQRTKTLAEELSSEEFKSKNEEIAMKSATLGNGYSSVVILLISIIGLGFSLKALIDYIRGDAGGAQGFLRVFLGLLVTFVAVAMIKLIMKI